MAAEPDNRSRIRKAYLLVYGREPSEQEIKLGIEYLHAEPMREYEENKNKPAEALLPVAGVARRRRRRASRPVTRRGQTGAEGGAVADAAAGADGRMPMGMGMMGGMGGFAGGFGGAAADARRRPAVPTTVKYEPTAWGRYAKVLVQFQRVSVHQLGKGQCPITNLPIR